MPVLVDAAGISVARSDRTLFADLSVTVSDGDRVGVVGINGTGKSTLLRVLAGSQPPDAGVVRRGRGVRIAVLDQEAALPDGSVQSVAGGTWEGQAVLDRLGMSAEARRGVSELSGGQAKRVALARVLAAASEMLILDEPTNHLDLPAVAWLEDWLGRYPGGVVMVSHDRHLLDRVTTRMIELDRGRAYVHEDGYAGYLQARADREAMAAGAEATRRNLARAELAWLRRGAPARTRKPQARVEAARRLLSAAPDDPARREPLELDFGTPRLGSLVIEVDDATVGRPGSPGPVLSGITLALDRRERMGVVGLNGSGKSTLLDLLAGRIQPVGGRLRTGPTVRLGYYTQQGPELDPSGRVRDLVAGPTRTPGDPADNRLMERFWFTGELPWATVGTLSGGERRRLQLLMVLAGRPNVLLLDEPTNDLDLDTLRALEDYLEGWPGAVVAVSHDRTFLDRVADRIVACRDGAVGAVAGGLAVWLAGAGTPRADRDAGKVAKVRPARVRPGRSATTVGFELRRLDKEVARLTRERDRLAEALQMASDHREMAAVGAELAVVQSRLEEVEDRWLELAEEAESSR